MAINPRQIQLSTDQRLVGRFTTGQGVAEEIVLGNGLSIVAGILSSSATEVIWRQFTQNLGTKPRSSGSFVVTTTGLTANRQVLVMMATGSGANADDMEWDAISANGVAISSTQFICHWSSPTSVSGNKTFNYLQV